MKTSIIALGLLSTGVFFSANSLASVNIDGLSPEEAGLAIITESDKRDTGFVSNSAGMKMTLINRKGKKSVRNLRSKTLEQLDQGDKSLSIFDEPADVKGTAMLTHSHGLDPDDQWLYLPALKRVKRISSKNKSGPFMGSEFAFEDLGSQEIEKYSYTLLGEEQLNGVDVYKIERIPQYKHSGYTKQIAWLDKEHLRSMKVEYYDRKKSLLKTLESSDFKQFKGQYWRPHRMFMQNHQTQKATELLFVDYVFEDPSVKANDFISNALKRIR